MHDEWVQSQGLSLVYAPHPGDAIDSWHIGMAKAPAEPLEPIVGDLLDNLRNALDFAAWSIFKAAGGDDNSRQAKQVYFPIANDVTAWPNTLKVKIPNAWPEAAGLLQSLQPFNQPDDRKTALRVLHGINLNDKHRHLSLVAANVRALKGTTPELTGKQAYMLIVVRPGPVISLGYAELIAQAAIMDGTIEEQPRQLKRSECAPLLQGPPPEFTLAFRSGDLELEIDALPSLIILVEEIVEKVGELADPS